MKDNVTVALQTKRYAKKARERRRNCHDWPVRVKIVAICFIDEIFYSWQEEENRSKAAIISIRDASEYAEQSIGGKRQRGSWSPDFTDETGKDQGGQRTV